MASGATWGRSGRLPGPLRGREHALGVTALETALRQICADFTETRRSFALVGGLAVSARTEPRFTRDADIAVAVDSDAEAEAVVRRLRSTGRGTRAAAAAPCQGRHHGTLDRAEGSLQRRRHTPTGRFGSASASWRGFRGRHHSRASRTHIDCRARIPPRTRSPSRPGDVASRLPRAALTTPASRRLETARIRVRPKLSGACPS